MTQTPEFDLQKAHHFFAANCFNQTWDYIDKPARTSEEGLAMLLASMASLWHWTQRKEVTPTNLSVGYWQLSRSTPCSGKQRMPASLVSIACRQAGRKVFHLSTWAMPMKRWHGQKKLPVKPTRRKLIFPWRVRHARKSQTTKRRRCCSRIWIPCEAP